MSTVVLDVVWLLVELTLVLDSSNPLSLFLWFLSSRRLTMGLLFIFSFVLYQFSVSSISISTKEVQQEGVSFLLSIAACDCSYFTKVRCQELF